ncbi:MAG: DNA-directed RNA polymerase subunit omega [Candidatus Hydrogenedentota bacterium]
MTTRFSVDDFAGKIDSLYRLVIVASRRANQLRTEVHGFSGVAQQKKPTIAALEEVLNDKVGWTTTEQADEELLDMEE